MSPRAPRPTSSRTFVPASGTGGTCGDVNVIGSLQSPERRVYVVGHGPRKHFIETWTDPSLSRGRKVFGRRFPRKNCPPEDGRPNDRNPWASKSSCRKKPPLVAGNEKVGENRFALSIVDPAGRA